MDCRVRLVQIDPVLGDVALNLETHLAEIERAIADGIDLVVFPELSLTGYFLKDQTPEVATRADDPVFDPLLERSREISILCGFVERSDDDRVFNALGLFEDGGLIHVHRKVHLVAYGMFEESRDLAAGEDFEVCESKHGRLGFLTCEDAWHIDGAYLYFLDGADAIVVASAGPGRGVTGEGGELSSNRVWRTLQDAFALFFRTWVLYCNRVGWEDGIVFAGASRVVDPFGEPFGEPLGLDPAGLDVHLTSAPLVRARTQTPLRRDERPWILARELARRVGFSTGAEERGRTMIGLDIDVELVADLLTRFLRAEAGKFGFSNAVLGLSGGIDSAVSAALAARAFGPRHVLCVLMPYRTSSADSKADALAVADALGARTRLVDISTMVDGYLVQESVEDRLRRGNVMARARMIVLYDFSAAETALVIGTSNKTELLLGYSTQFGDSASALNPLGDLYKHQVYQLARHLGLPPSVIDKAPSADLFEGQSDEDDLGFSYDDADRILVRMVDERRSEDELIDEGFDPELVRMLARRIVQNQYKRLPPIIAKLGDRTINHDFRYLRSWRH